MRRVRLSRVVVLGLVIASCARGREQVQIMDASTEGAVVHMTVASCNASPAAEVQGSAERVVITVTADRPGMNQDDCADGLSVELGDPLGSRSLFDGSIDEPVLLK